MLKHHEESIRNVVQYFQSDPEVEALVLGGSLAHGFASPISDVDVMILVSDEQYAQRMNEGRLHFFNRELCTYPEGYVDGKYLGMPHLDQVAEKGSEPARFAFQDARVLFSQRDSLNEKIRLIASYPAARKAERIGRFYAQFEAWNWYVHEALKSGNRYLLGMSISKLVLFGGRLILAHNELLYPYHKWFLKVLAGAKEKPAELLTCIESLYQTPSDENTQSFYEMIKGFQDWEVSGNSWPVQFMFDSELNWQTGVAPVDDL
ncbi:MAG: nucleotidyltransferase domain-containing protein [Anaerolineales bacterium]